jgi:LPXTG-motif cell wall-anchored protein
MKDRFPADLLAVVFGPVLVAIIVVALGFVIFHAEQLRGSVAAYAIAIVAIAALLGIVFFRRRRRQ